MASTSGCDSTIETTRGRRPSATPQGTTAPPARRSRDPWRIELDGIRIQDLREISIGESSLIGKGSLAGGLDFAVPAARSASTVLSLSFADARLMRAGNTVGENVSFTIEALLGAVLSRGKTRCASPRTRRDPPPSSPTSRASPRWGSFFK